MTNSNANSTKKAKNTLDEPSKLLNLLMMKQTEKMITQKINDKTQSLSVIKDHEESIDVSDHTVRKNIKNAKFLFQSDSIESTE